MPGVVITGPACTPARYGLLSVAEVEDRTDASQNWEMGFEHDLGSCEDLIVLGPRCPPTPENKAPSLQGVTTEDGSAFTLVAGYTCSVPGRSIEQAWDFAEQRLVRGEARTLERTFWTGIDNFGNTIEESLRGATDITPVPGTAVSITDGMALLESYMGDATPCAPIIHAQRGIATYLAERRLIAPVGSTMYANGTGSRVVVGGGYQTTGPDGVAAPAGQAWLYATGGVKILRGPTFLTPERGLPGAAVDRTINDVTVFAERTYGIMLDCGKAAVLVDLKACCC